MILAYSNRSITLVIDAMGGDSGLEVTIPAALQCLEDQRLKLILVGIEPEIKAWIDRAKISRQWLDRVEISHAPEVISMDDNLSVAMRRKKQSSMRLSLELVKAGQAQGVVSAGNTGALMAISRLVLKTIPGIERPAIVANIPSATSDFYMLDLGANVDCTARHLYQFAMMGSVLVQVLKEIESPRVGLLNIGHEEIKGNEQVKQANQALVQASLTNYIGYVEADSIFFDAADVVVCDGFVGNVALKCMEGVARMIAAVAKQKINEHLSLKLLAGASKSYWSSLKASLDPRQYNGASLLGLLGTVVKSHGGADQEAFSAAVRVAIKEVAGQVPERIAEKFDKSQQQSEVG